MYFINSKSSNILFKWNKFYINFLTRYLSFYIIIQSRPTRIRWVRFLHFKFNRVFVIYSTIFKRTELSNCPFSFKRPELSYCYFSFKRTELSYCYFLFKTHTPTKRVNKLKGEKGNKFCHNV